MKYKNPSKTLTRKPRGTSQGHLVFLPASLYLRSHPEGWAPGLESCRATQPVPSGQHTLRAVLLPAGDSELGLVNTSDTLFILLLPLSGIWSRFNGGPGMVQEVHEIRGSQRTSPKPGTSITMYSDESPSSCLR